MGLAEEQYLANESEVHVLDLEIKRRHEEIPQLDPEVYRIVEEAKRLRRQTI